MTNRNQVPHLSPRAKAAKRRERIGRFFVFAVALGCIAVTAFAWWMRAQG